MTLSLRVAAVKVSLLAAHIKAIAITLCPGVLKHDLDN